MRFKPFLALSAMLLMAACQNPDGSINYANSALLGAGVGAAGGLIAAGASDNGPRYSNGGGYYGGGGYYAPQPRYQGGGRGYYGRGNYGRGYYR